MSKRPRSALTADGFVRVPRPAVPFDFVLDALAAAQPWTRRMFGCYAVYIGPKIVLALRQSSTYAVDNGVLLATAHEHHDSLREDFPHMRSITFLGKPPTGWQVLPVDAPDFEESARKAAELVLAGDSRIGKLPRSTTKRKRNED